MVSEVQGQGAGLCSVLIGTSLAFVHHGMASGEGACIGQRTALENMSPKRSWGPTVLRGQVSTDL